MINDHPPARFADVQRGPDGTLTTFQKRLNTRGFVDVLCYLGHISHRASSYQRAIMQKGSTAAANASTLANDTSSEIHSILEAGGFLSDMDFYAFLVVYKLYCDSYTQKIHRAYDYCFGAVKRTARDAYDAETKQDRLDLLERIRTEDRFSKVAAQMAAQGGRRGGGFGGGRGRGRFWCYIWRKHSFFWTSIE